MRLRRGIYDKKGAAHFEMIISFVFFISFIFFLFVVLKPYNTNTLSGAVITGMYDSFNDEVTTNLTNVFLAADYDSVANFGESCLKVELPDQVFAYGITESVVTDINGIDIDSEVEGSSPSGLYIEDTTEDFYKVSISPEFSEEDLTNCLLIPNYQVGSIVEREVVSYTSLETMAVQYNSGTAGYESLKSQLKVPSVFDFAIVSGDLPDISMVRVVPDSEDVIAEEYILEVLHTNGTVVNARFTLTVW